MMDPASVTKRESACGHGTVGDSLLPGPEGKVALSRFNPKAVITISSLLAACTPSSPPAEPPEPVIIVDTVRIVDTVEVSVEAAADAQLQERVARLQLQLLERDALIAGMQGQLNGAQQEVVRNMAKLQSQASRAEAASGMAEADIALQSLADLDGGRTLPEHAQGLRLLEETRSEFDSENYAGALYLATEVRALAQRGQARLGGAASSDLREGESIFVIPVPLQTVRNSNVRGGPGLGFDVQFTLEQGAQVEGRSYTSQWVRIVDGQGREGWIFHTLVTSQP